MVFIYLIPFKAAYIRDTDPVAFNKQVDVDTAAFRKIKDDQAVATGKPKMTDDQLKLLREKIIGFYSPYSNILRSLGITTQQEKLNSVWDSNESEVFGNSDSGFPSAEFPNNDFQNNDFQSNNNDFGGEPFPSDTEVNKKW